MQVTIITAQELSPNQFKKIQQLLAKKYEAKLEYRQQVDPTVIGGIRVIVGSKEIDATVQGKLNQLQAQLMDLV